MEMQMRKIFYSLLFFIFILPSCSIKLNEDYKNSLSIKEFLYKTQYSIVVDGIKITKYDQTKKVNTNDEIILELLDKKDKQISEMLLVDVKTWHKFPETNIYVIRFKSM
ncbi:MAG: hypothetical protein DRN27_09195 [Thermoplasmata archaeon]|nr:MAG: hypothetical protein DRN27_09195 [Thermoplasmata archaeon]